MDEKSRSTTPADTTAPGTAPAPEAATPADVRAPATPSAPAAPAAPSTPAASTAPHAVPLPPGAADIAGTAGANAHAAPHEGGWSAPSSTPGGHTGPAGENPWSASATSAATQPHSQGSAPEGSPFGTPTPAPDTTTVFAAQGGSPVYPAAPKPKSRRGAMLLAGLAIGAVLGGGAGAAVTALVGDDDTTTPGVTRSDLGTSDDKGDSTSNQQASTMSNVEDVAATVLPSVVSISVRTQMGEGTGTGVIISSDGEILTNNHVVEGAGQNGQVQVTFSDGTTADAEVLGTDPTTDLAVIKAQDVSGLTPAQLGSSADIAVGEQVVAIGSPLGLEGTVTTGIVSALNRPVQTGDQNSQESSVMDAIQTDAPINPGNSGGPLVNMAGEVIGINSAIATTGQSSGSIGLGFSIPIDQAKPIADELLKDGEATHARIGVGVGDPQDGTRGALIASVEANSSGAEAGLQEGDVVTKIDDRIITNGTSLVAAARSHRPGDTVTLTYLRDGEEQTTELTLGSDASTS